MEETNREATVVQLLGAVVALARACEGNKNRPDNTTHNTMLSALYLAIPGTGLDRQQAENVLRRLRMEKQKLVPRCTDCTKQCGRNDEYSVYELSNDGPQVTVLKETLLTGLLSFEPLLRGELSGELYEKAMAFLYDGFYWLGKPCEPDELGAVIVQMDTLKAQLAKNMLLREQILIEGEILL